MEESEVHFLVKAMLQNELPLSASSHYISSNMIMNACYVQTLKMFRVLGKVNFIVLEKCGETVAFKFAKEKLAKLQSQLEALINLIIDLRPHIEDEQEPNSFKKYLTYAHQVGCFFETLSCENSLPQSLPLRNLGFVEIYFTSYPLHVARLVMKGLTSNILSLERLGKLLTERCPIVLDNDELSAFKAVYYANAAIAESENFAQKAEFMVKAFKLAAEAGPLNIDRSALTKLFIDLGAYRSIATLYCNFQQFASDRKMASLEVEVVSEIMALLDSEKISAMHKKLYCQEFLEQGKIAVKVKIYEKYFPDQLFDLVCGTLPHKLGGLQLFLECQMENSAADSTEFSTAVEMYCWLMCLNKEFTCAIDTLIKAASRAEPCNLSVRIKFLSKAIDIANEKRTLANKYANWKQTLKVAVLQQKMIGEAEARAGTVHQEILMLKSTLHASEQLYTLAEKHSLPSSIFQLTLIQRQKIDTKSSDDIWKIILFQVSKESTKVIMDKMYKFSDEFGFPSEEIVYQLETLLVEKGGEESLVAKMSLHYLGLRKSISRYTSYLQDRQWSFSMKRIVYALIYIVKLMFSTGERTKSDCERIIAIIEKYLKEQNISSNSQIWYDLACIKGFSSA